MSMRIWGRRATLASSATLVAVLCTSTAPASAGLLDGLLTPVVTPVVSPVVSTVDDTTAVVGTTVEGVLGAPGRRTGWRVESGSASLAHVADATGASGVRSRGYDGTGVGVALVDTGVAPVRGLSGGNVVNGPDLSFESQSPEHRYLDTFGHGTHLAGIIAGNRPSTAQEPGLRGIAPGAQLTSLKVASADGAVDVSQVIAAVDWVVQHRDDDPQHPIRVLNLAYGTDGVQDHERDPLTHAVENAWRAGIVVVVAGGNSGTDQPRLNNPAYDPYVLAVGASDTGGTVRSNDDVVPAFSSRGDASRRVDLVAPGSSIVSLRDPGSFLDEAHPAARVGESDFKGSGSSQAAAVVSGAVALLLDARPELTPDQVKAVLRASASHLPQADAAGRGAGALDVERALWTTSTSTRQSFPPSTGLGSLELARGTQHVAMDGTELTGEQHVLGAFDAATWAPRSAAFSAWSGGTWAGGDWTADCWCDDSWTGKSWTGKSWTGKSWTGKSWTAESWSGKSWTGKSWTGKSWTGTSWTGKSWTGTSWAGSTWD